MIADARGFGLRVVQAHIPDGTWATLHAATRLALGVERHLAATSADADRREGAAGQAADDTRMVR